MTALIKRVNTLSNSDCTTLIIGETGTGKEVLADYIHRTSSRKHNHFVKINLSAFPKDLLESELFGFERGAFTGADKAKPGLFETANNGTIFLDDIEDLPYPSQVKLLRVIETKEAYRLGSLKPYKTNVRILSATKSNLKERVKEGSFRIDLFYRLNVETYLLPPLRERKEDIPLLIEFFVDKYKSTGEVKIPMKIMNFIHNYNWPGNIRELQNLIHKICLNQDKEIELSDLAEYLFLEHDVNSNNVMQCLQCMKDEGMSFKETVECLEKQLIERALLDSNGNLHKASRRLRLSISTMRDKMKRLDVEVQKC